MSLKISEFFPPTQGKLKGTCVVCGDYTEHGNKIDFSSNFTAWSLLQEGNCICEHCYTLCRDQTYRRNSWVASKEGVKLLKRDQILKTMLEPPEPPFAIYATSTGKKQGFLRLIRKPAMSKKQYFIAFDDFLLFVDTNLLREMVEVATEAVNLKFKKYELKEPSMDKWIKYKELCKKIEEYRENPLWDLVVWAV